MTNIEEEIKEIIEEKPKPEVIRVKPEDIKTVEFPIPPTRKIYKDKYILLDGTTIVGTFNNMEDVAEKIGVTRQAIYYHLKKKNSCHIKHYKIINMKYADHKIIKTLELINQEAMRLPELKSVNRVLENCLKELREI